MSSPAPHDPLPLRVAPNSSEMVQYLIAMATRVNQFSEDQRAFGQRIEKHDEVVAQVSADMLRVAGEAASHQLITSEQMQKLTDAVQQLRQLLVLPPSSGETSKLITLPHIVVDEVQLALAKAELEKRRQDSIRVRAEKLQDERMVHEDALARKRDHRNTKFLLWGTLAIGVIIEVLRVLITHQP